MIVDFLNELYRQLDWWVAVGFVAQFCFAGRFFLQWFASERANKSVIPISFWWLSIVGAVLLLIYAVQRRDPVFIFGQLVAMGIYLRNLQMMLR